MSHFFTSDGLSFSYSISPSNEYSGLISFRKGWLDLLAFQGTLKSLLQQHSSKASLLWHSAFFTVLQSLMKVQAPGRPCPALCIFPWLPTWALDVCLAAPPGCVSKTHFHFAFPCSLLLSCDITFSTEDLDLTNVRVTKSQKWYKTYLINIRRRTKELLAESERVTKLA